jgi:pimeloyl-ACP methyl ester carboxylesterase
MSRLEWGAGDTAVVLLHGVGGGAAAWQGNAPAIAEAGFAVVAPDFPGYGDSPSIDPYDMAGLAASVVAVLDALAASRVVLVGHSMGGMVAQEVVARAKDRVHGLVVCNASPAFGKPGGAWQQQFLAERLGPLDAGVGMAGLAARLVPAMLAPLAPRAAVEQAIALMSAVPEPTYRNALHALSAFDRRDNLARIAVPTLAITGEHDRSAPSAMVQQMALRIRGAEYVCISGAGHLANIETPQPFNRALVSFLTRHFGT